MCVCVSSSSDSSHVLTMHHFKASKIVVFLTTAKSLSLVVFNLLPSSKKKCWIETYLGITNLPVKDLLVPCVGGSWWSEFSPSSTRKNRSESFQTLLFSSFTLILFTSCKQLLFWAITFTPKTPSCHLLFLPQDVSVLKKSSRFSLQKNTEVSKFGHLRMSWPTWVQRMPCARLPIWESDFLIPWRITAQTSLPQDSSGLDGKIWCEHLHLLGFQPRYLDGKWIHFEDVYIYIYFPVKMEKFHCDVTELAGNLDRISKEWPPFCWKKILRKLRWRISYFDIFWLVGVRKISIGAGFLP